MSIVIKRFAQMRLRLAKTDKADANMIRKYAEAEKPKVWSPPQEYAIQADEINGLITLLIRQRTALKNKLHSVNHKEGTFSMILKILQKQIKNLDLQINQLGTSMEELIKEHQGEMLTTLCSIPGIGKRQLCF